MWIWAVESAVCLIQEWKRDLTREFTDIKKKQQGNIMNGSMLVNSTTWMKSTNSLKYINDQNIL